MEINLENPEETYSWRLAVKGAAMFIVYGLGMILMALPLGPLRAGPVQQLVFWLLIACGVLIPYIGTGVGWVNGFPRWSFSYLGLALFLSSYLQNVSSRGIVIGRWEMSSGGAWGWRAWIPLALAALTALVVTRFSTSPLRRLLRRAWADWTQLSYAMFGCLPILVLVVFLEAKTADRYVFSPLLALILVATALFYLRAEQRRQRVWALLVGTLLILVILTVIPALMYSDEGPVDVPGLFLAILTVMVLFFSPALIELFKYIRSKLAKLWK